MTKTAKVFAALRSGCRTSKEVDGVTGFGIHRCAALIRHLVDQGKVEATEEFVRSEGLGRPARIFRVAR